jgi:hypothetical protein
MSEVLQSPPQHVGGSDGGAAAWAPSPAPRTSVTQAPPLRIGILVDELVQPAWIERVLRETLGAGVGIVAAVIVNAGDAAGGGSGEAAPRDAGGSGVTERTSPSPPRRVSTSAGTPAARARRTRSWTSRRSSTARRSSA